MENSIDLKSIWSSQPVPEANQAEVFKKIDKYKRSGAMKSILLNAVLVLTILLVLAIWIYFQPQFITTKLGIVITVLAMALVIFYNGKLIPLYKKADESQSNKAYLTTLLEVQKRTYFIQARIMNLYFILLSAGIGLYMYEYVVRMPSTWAVASYTIVALWFAFNWFVLRPRIIKKNRKKMEDLLDSLETVKDQFGED